MGQPEHQLAPAVLLPAPAETSREILTPNQTPGACPNLEERTYTLLRNAARPGHTAGQESGRHPAAKEKGSRGMVRKTPAQKVAALERAERRARFALSKAGRDQRTHAMCVLAGAIAAELRVDQAQALWVLDVVRRRVTKPRDHAGVMQWLSTL